MQARCTATTAEYSLIDDETLVHNECHLDTVDGLLSQVDGTATPEDDRFSYLRFSSSLLFKQTILLLRPMVQTQKIPMNGLW